MAKPPPAKPAGLPKIGGGAGPPLPKIGGSKPLPTIGGGGTRQTAPKTTAKPTFKDSDDEDDDWVPSKPVARPTAGTKKMAFFDDDSD